MDWITLAREADADEVWKRVKVALGSLHREHRLTAQAAGVGDDLDALDTVERLADPEKLCTPFDRLARHLESVERNSPELLRRLQLTSAIERPSRLWALVDEADTALRLLSVKLWAAAAEVKQQIREEDGRGRPPNPPGEKDFAAAMMEIFLEFSPSGTSAGRNNAFRQRGVDGPFHGFVKEAGCLVDPNFVGREACRHVWEASRGDSKT